MSDFQYLANLINWALNLDSWHYRQVFQTDIQVACILLNEVMVRFVELYQIGLHSQVSEFYSTLNQQGIYIESHEPENESFSDKRVFRWVQLSDVENHRQIVFATRVTAIRGHKTVENTWKTEDLFIPQGLLLYLQSLQLEKSFKK